MSRIDKEELRQCLIVILVAVKLIQLTGKLGTEWGIKIFLKRKEQIKCGLMG
jgi:hypothetical protein